MAHCALCLKTADIGKLVSHAKNRTRHLRKPNLHVAHLAFNGVKKKMMLCTKCKRATRVVVGKK